MNLHVDQILGTIDDVLEPGGAWFLLQRRRGTITHTPRPGSDVSLCGRGRVNRSRPYVPGDLRCEDCTTRLTSPEEGTS